MATLLFIALKFAGRIDSPYDGYWFSLMVALDSQTLLRWWLWRSSGR